MNSDASTDPSATPGSLEPAEGAVSHRAELLPEEQAAGSDDPQAQAEAILEESLERTEQPDPEASSQTAGHGDH